MSQLNGTFKACGPRIPWGPGVCEHLQNVQQQVLSAMFPWEKEKMSEQLWWGTSSHKNWIDINPNSPPTACPLSLGEGLRRIRGAFWLNPEERAPDQQLHWRHTFSKEMTSIYRRGTHYTDGHRPSVHKTGWFLVNSFCFLGFLQHKLLGAFDLIRGWLDFSFLCIHLARWQGMKGHGEAKNNALGFHNFSYAKDHVTEFRANKGIFGNTHQDSNSNVPRAFWIMFFFFFSNSPDTVITYCPILSFQWSGESCNQILFQIQSWKTHHERLSLGKPPAKRQVLGSKYNRYKTPGIVHKKEGKPILFPFSEHEWKNQKGVKNKRKECSWYWRTQQRFACIFSTHMRQWFLTSAWNLRNLTEKH